MGRASSAELDELREAWAQAVLLDPRYPGDVTMPRPCWFSDAAEDLRERPLGLPHDLENQCEGRIEGAHWIKRQTVERSLVAGGLWVEDPDHGDGWYYEDDLIQLAAWDPRNGVPACERHHRIFDSQRVPLPSEQIVIFREQVPAHVEAFARDWGLEHELERKHRPMGEGI